MVRQTKMAGVAERIGNLKSLDRIARPMDKAAARLIPPGRAKDALSGVQLGHPVHPMLTDVVIGAFMSATTLDLLAGQRGAHAAEVLVGVGLAAAVPTVASGLSDWAGTYGPDKRLGVAHAAGNATANLLYAASLAARRRGHRAAGVALGLAGMGAMSLGAYLGGHLSFARGVGVNNAFWQHLPEEWTAVTDEAAVPEGTGVTVNSDGADVLLFRRDGHIHAISDRCSHAGGPLHEGEIDAGEMCVTCPWHQSVFRLTDGAVVHGPASVPQAAFDVRVEGGKVEIRNRS